MRPSHLHCMVPFQHTTRAQSTTAPRIAICTGSAANIFQYFKPQFSRLACPYCTLLRSVYIPWLSRTLRSPRRGVKNEKGRHSAGRPAGALLNNQYLKRLHCVCACVLNASSANACRYHSPQPSFSSFDDAGMPP